MLPFRMERKLKCDIKLLLKPSSSEKLTPTIEHKAVGWK